MDEKGDYERQRETLDQRRQAAVAEILQNAGIGTRTMLPESALLGTVQSRS